MSVAHSPVPSALQFGLALYLQYGAKKMYPLSKNHLFFCFFLRKHGITSLLFLDMDFCAIWGLHFRILLGGVGSVGYNSFGCGGMMLY